MKQIIILFLSFFFTSLLKAQTVQFRIIDKANHHPVTAATISEGKQVLAVADSSGNATIQASPGDHLYTFSSAGFENVSREIKIPHEGVIIIMMERAEQSLETVTVISSTRNNQRIENSPLKVEVLGREELNEEGGIKPGNIASLIGDFSGIQMQQSSAVSGNSNVRIQGLEGRYTQILRDGMPLYEGFSGNFGILSIPPLDLRQIELIKGSASTLYGGGAIGGLVNLISKTPLPRQEAVVTLNRSTLEENNLNTYVAKKYKKFGYTLFSGYTYQNPTDVNKDGFSDVPKLKTFIVHPRLFFYPDEETTITAGYTGNWEHRDGGDMLVLNGRPDAVHQYVERNSTDRQIGEFMVDRMLSGNQKLSFKSSFSSFDRQTTTNTHFFKGNQLNYFTELSWLAPYGGNSFVGGVNLSGDRFKKLPSDPILLDNYSNNIIGAFAQNTWVIKDNTSLEAGLRDDYHPTYGNFFLPRLAAFHRFNQHWGARAGMGLGYKIPNPLATQIIDYSIEEIMPIGSEVKAEKSVGYNAEVNYKKTWENGNRFFINHAFFLTRIANPIVVTEKSNHQVNFINATGPVVTQGFDTYIQTRIHEWDLYAGYTYTIAQRKYLQPSQFIPLTPRNRAAFTVVREFEEQGWRIGLEGSYSGSQYRMDMSRTPGYYFAAAMIGKSFGKHIYVVLNGENLFDYRQSKEEPLFTGSISDPQFNPLWAPIDGRVINCSIKLSL